MKLFRDAYFQQVPASHEPLSDPLELIGCGWEPMEEVQQLVRVTQPRRPTCKDNDVEGYFELLDVIHSFYPVIPAVYTDLRIYNREEFNVCIEGCSPPHLLFAYKDKSFMQPLSAYAAYDFTKGEFYVACIKTVFPILAFYPDKTVRVCFDELTSVLYKNDGSIEFTHPNTLRVLYKPRVSPPIVTELLDPERGTAYQIMEEFHGDSVELGFDNPDSQFMNFMVEVNRGVGFFGRKTASIAKKLELPSHDFGIVNTIRDNNDKLSNWFYSLDNVFAYCHGIAQASGLLNIKPRH